MVPRLLNCCASCDVQTPRHFHFNAVQPSEKNNNFEADTLVLDLDLQADYAVLWGLQTYRQTVLKIVRDWTHAVCRQGR